MGLRTTFELCRLRPGRPMSIKMVTDLLKLTEQDADFTWHQVQRSLLTPLCEHIQPPPHVDVKVHAHTSTMHAGQYSLWRCASTASQKAAPIIQISDGEGTPYYMSAVYIRGTKPLERTPTAEPKIQPRPESQQLQHPNPEPNTLNSVLHIRQMLGRLR